MRFFREAYSIKQLRVTIAICCVLLGIVTFYSEMSAQTNGKKLYTVKITDDPITVVSVFQKGSELRFVVSQRDKNYTFTATSGIVRTCRTEIYYESGEERVSLSLPIAKPNTPCQMMPGTTTMSVSRFGLKADAMRVEKVSGNDAQLRKATETTFKK